MQSKRESSVLCSQICSEICLNSSYLPWMGLAAARMDVRELSRVVMPAFATLMVCCSIAQWIATRSPDFILSNQSMQTIPPSASTKAPPSIWNSPVELSFDMLAVKPAADDPFPDVYTAIEEVCSTNLRNCDLAVEGSPMRRMFISPLRAVWSGRCFLDPPKSMQAMVFLIYSLPKMPGAIDLYIIYLILGSLPICLKSSYSDSVNWLILLSFNFYIPVTQMYPFDRFSVLTSETSIMPVILTLSPGTHLETFYRSTIKLQVRATYPVGTSYGFSWIFKFWASITTESGMATKGSFGHFWLIPDCPRQRVGTQGYCPGVNSMVLVSMQFLHLIFNFDALMQGLVAVMMIPVTVNNFETILLLISLNFLGIQSLRSDNCHSPSCTLLNSYFFSLTQARTPSSITFSIYNGLFIIFSNRCSSKPLRSARSTTKKHFPLCV